MVTQGPFPTTVLLSSFLGNFFSARHIQEIRSAAGTMIKSGFVCNHAVGPCLLTSIHIDVFYSSNLNMLQNACCKLEHITLHLALERVCLCEKHRLAVSALCTYARFTSSISVSSLKTPTGPLLYFQVSWQKDRFDISAEWKPILSTEVRSQKCNVLRGRS